MFWRLPDRGGGRGIEYGSRSFGNGPRYQLLLGNRRRMRHRGVLCGKETYASDIDGVRFRRGSQSPLLSKCTSHSGRRRSHERGCRRHINGARGAVLRAAHSAWHRQMLPGIRCRTSSLSPLLPLVVVALTLKGSELLGSQPRCTATASRVPACPPIAKID